MASRSYEIIKPFDSEQSAGRNVGIISRVARLRGREDRRRLLLMSTQGQQPHLGRRIERYGCEVGAGHQDGKTY
jgi:hypothetical protein